MRECGSSADFARSEDFDVDQIKAEEADLDYSGHRRVLLNS